MRFCIESKSSKNILEEVSYLTNNYLNEKQIHDILKKVLDVHYNDNVDMSNIENLISKSSKEILVKFKKALINKICENSGANCYDYLDKMAPYVDKGNI